MYRECLFLLCILCRGVTIWYICIYSLPKKMFAANHVWQFMVSQHWHIEWGNIFVNVIWILYSIISTHEMKLEFPELIPGFFHSWFVFREKSGISTEIINIYWVQFACMFVISPFISQEYRMFDTWSELRNLVITKTSFQCFVVMKWHSLWVNICS